MSKREKEERICFYCDTVFSASGGVGDHFPIPKRHGGTLCVPCCISCHDLKDRIGLYRWDVNMMAKVTQDWPKLSRETRIFLAKSLAIVQDANKTLDDAEAKT